MYYQVTLVLFFLVIVDNGLSIILYSC